jgi:hypothetical protein
MKTTWTPTPGTQIAQVADLVKKGKTRDEIRELLKLSNDASYYFAKKKLSGAKPAKAAKAAKARAKKPATVVESWIVECIVHAPTGPFRVFAKESDFVEAFSRAMVAAKGSVR